ncbi:Neutral ceramidase precursor [Gimesia alba]|uniref:Neutral ceramidase n=1 Tax=Gimesia alba TaxID=2527973 RepID=A0A517RK64_9PLAN|nr:neutral/alkaline non-lysosomal ceramidase N-terminal domain-containing protein [Gimesia alba]QDT44261.1 Neutral ceramidase precursor [Gimesia alba]
MLRLVLFCLTALLVWAPSMLLAGDWKVGMARVDITPTKKIWLGGYASRKKPAEGTTHPLWAKALVFEDKQGSRAAIVTTDLIGLTREISDAVGKRVAQKTGITREQILLNCSHTHSSPVVLGCASLAYDLSPVHQKEIEDYAKQLQDNLVKVIVEASQSLSDASLSYGEERATFAINRRGRINPDGPVDHTVPVLRVNDPTGKMRAVLFGYACHNTTIALFKYCGDYAGFAQVALEKKYPGTMALFMIGCGGDANPDPRGTLALAEQHGNSLAEAVIRAVDQPLEPIHGPLTVKMKRTDLPFVAPPTKAELLKQQGKGDVYSQRLTKYLLNQLDEQGAIATSYPFSVQVIQFGDDLTLIGLGGETVIDYSIRLHEEFSDRRIWVAGYCNEVFAYVPSERVLKEGGYEGGGAMKYFGFHGPFKPGVEDRVIQLVHSLVTP